jgi:glycine hydroxymethyltransferase
MAAYLSVLKPGDPILGMDLPNGGHLTHGHPVNFSGILFQSFSYGVDRNTQLIDYDVVERIAKECRPKMIVVGASAYAQTLDFKRFRAIATSIGAYLLADIAHIAGLVAAGLHPSPIPHADFVTTTTHKTLRGPRGGIIMCRQEFAKAVDKAVFPGLQGGPLMHVIAAKAVALKEAQSQNFRAYQQQVITNAKVLAGELRQRGYTIVSGDTDTHLFLVDLSPKGISGKAAELALDASGITVNKNTIPYDHQPPAIASGIRLGTPIVSSQGMGPSEMALIAALIDRVIGNLNDPTIHETVKLEIQSLCGKFPNKRLTT